MCGAPEDKSDRVMELQNQRDRERRAEQLADQERARQEKAAADAADEVRFKSELESALSGARNRATGRVTSLGLNADEFMPIFDREFSAIRSTIPNRSQNVGNFFGADTIDNILSGETNTRRQRYNREVGNTFSTGFENSLFSDTADDPFVESILGKQASDAELALERARARGDLDEMGFERGRSRIGELRRAGQSTAQALSNAVVSRYRGQAGDIANRARNAANSYELGNTFSLDPFIGEKGQLRDRFSSGLQGEVEGALTGQQFFDLGDILGRASMAQGAVNPQVARNPFGMNNPNEDRNRQQRGLTGGGSF